MLRGRYFTVRHPLLTCGHKLDMVNQPKNNCDSCWFHFFNTHPQLVEVADQFYRTQGRGPMIGMRGIKFVKNFGRYMVTIIRLAQEEAKRKEQADGARSQEPNVGSSTGPNDSAEPSEATAVAS